MVIKTQITRTLNYYIFINILAKYIEGIILKKTIRSFYNNLYPLYV